MNITVNIDAPELVGAINNLAAALGNNNPLAGVTQSEVSKPLETVAPKEEKPKAKKEKPIEPETVEPEPTPEPEPVKEEPKKTSGITLDVITTKTREYIQADPKNKAKLKVFLAEKEVGRVSELPESEYEATLAFFEGEGE